MSQRDVLEETYLMGKEIYKDFPKWDNLPDYDKLSISDLDEVFRLLMGLFSLVGVSDNSINKKGHLVEECIGLITQRRHILQKDPNSFDIP